MKFKVGERVAVYESHLRRTGTVEENPNTGPAWSGTVWINFGSGHKEHAHHKQCRLLKKKERRRIWILAANSPANMCPGQIQVYDCPGCDRVEFIEVKKK